MNFSLNPGHVRVDLFKPSGKWAYTGMVDMNRFYNTSGPATALENGMDEFGIDGLTTNWREWLEQGGSIVCIEPYHQYSFPVCLKR